MGNDPILPNHQKYEPNPNSEQTQFGCDDTIIYNPIEHKSQILDDQHSYSGDDGRNYDENENNEESENENNEESENESEDENIIYRGFYEFMFYPIVNDNVIIQYNEEQYTNSIKRLKINESMMHIIPTETKFERDIFDYVVLNNIENLRKSLIYNRNAHSTHTFLDNEEFRLLLYGLGKLKKHLNSNVDNIECDTEILISKNTNLTLNPDPKIQSDGDNPNQ